MAEKQIVATPSTPVTGDTVYADTALVPPWRRLAGNITATRKFLTQTGTGAISAAPVWNTITAGDLTGLVTLDSAYDGGRIITADAGPVRINKTANDATHGLEVDVSAGTGLAALFTGASISCPGAGFASERFGSSATAGGSGGVAIGASAAAGSGTGQIAIGASASTTTATGSIAIGNEAISRGSDGIAIGRLASTSSASNVNEVAIGASAVSGANRCTVVGGQAAANGSGATALGERSIANGVGSIAIGQLATTGTNGNSIALGAGATNTAGNQLVIGSSSGSISSVIIGNGVTASVPQAVTIQTPSGSGTNIAGADFTMAGGQGTGTGLGGAVLIQTSPVGASGSALNALVTRVTVRSRGDTTVEGLGTGWVAKSLVSSFSALDNETAYSVDASSGAVTVNLPTAVGRAGKVFIIKKTDSSGNAVTVDASGAELIDGTLTRVISARYDLLILMSDSVNWIVLSDASATPNPATLAGAVKMFTLGSIGASANTGAPGFTPTHVFFFGLDAGLTAWFGRAKGTARTQSAQTTSGFAGITVTSRSGAVYYDGTTEWYMSQMDVNDIVVTRDGGVGTITDAYCIVFGTDDVTKVEPRTSDPASPATGRIWLRTDL